MMNELLATTPHAVRWAQREILSKFEMQYSKWLADGNEAMEAGNVERAVKCYGKSQFWRDRYNRLTGRA